MDDRIVAVAAVLVGVAVTVVGALEYVLPGFAPPPYDPFVTGVFVVVAGLLLAGAGSVAALNALDHLALRSATGVGLFALLLAVYSPDSLLFGGVFWFGMVVLALVALGAYRTAKLVRS